MIPFLISGISFVLLSFCQVGDNETDRERIFMPDASGGVKMPMRFIYKRVGDLKAGETGQVSKSSLIIDKKGYCWVDLTAKCRSSGDYEFNGNGSVSITKLEEGYMCKFRAGGLYIWTPVSIGGREVALIRKLIIIEQGVHR